MLIRAVLKTSAGRELFFSESECHIFCKNDRGYKEKKGKICVIVNGTGCETTSLSNITSLFKGTRLQFMEQPLALGRTSGADTTQAVCSCLATRVRPGSLIRQTCMGAFMLYLGVFYGGKGGTVYNSCCRFL